MNIKDILNADVETVGWWIRQGFVWWIDELVSVLPETWRARFSRGTGTIVEFNDDLTLREDGTALPDAPRAKRNVTIALPLSKVLTRTLEYPLLPLADIRRMVALDIDRLTPFREEAVFYDLEVIQRDQQNERQKILLGVLPRATVTQALSRAEANDLVPSAIGAMGNAGSNIHFDFLPAARNAQGAGRMKMSYWWAAVGVLAVANIGLLVFRDSSDLEALRQNVESQRATVAVALRLRGKVAAESERRAELLAEKKHNDPLFVLNAVSKALPTNAWAQRFEWNGQTVHIAGYRNGTADLLTPLETSNALHNAHEIGSSMQAPKDKTTKPFDIAADVKPGAAR